MSLSILQQLLFSLVQLLVAAILGAAAAYLAFYLFQRFTRDLDEWEALRQGNAAVGIVLGAILISVAILLRPALTVDISTWDAGRDLLLRALLTEGVQLVVGLILAVLTLTLALGIFASLTRGIDEVKELANGNLAVAGLLAGVAVGVALMVSQAVAQLMNLISSLLF